MFPSLCRIIQVRQEQVQREVSGGEAAGDRHLHQPGYAAPPGGVLHPAGGRRGAAAGSAPGQAQCKKHTDGRRRKRQHGSGLF